MYVCICVYVYMYTFVLSMLCTKHACLREFMSEGARQVHSNEHTGRDRETYIGFMIGIDGSDIARSEPASRHESDLGLLLYLHVAYEHVAAPVLVLAVLGVQAGFLPRVDAAHSA